jgi:hypothetical protein
MNDDRDVTIDSPPFDAPGARRWKVYQDEIDALKAQIAEILERISDLEAATVKP